MRDGTISDAKHEVNVVICPFEVTLAVALTGVLLTNYETPYISKYVRNSFKVRNYNPPMTFWLNPKTFRAPE